MTTNLPIIDPGEVGYKALLNGYDGRPWVCAFELKDGTVIDGGFAGEGVETLSVFLFDDDTATFTGEIVKLNLSDIDRITIY